MATNTNSPLPLTGVKVVDFGQYMAGPAVAMILADLGATVVHIDPPGAPLWETPANATLNRVLMEINPSFSPLPLSSAYGTMLAAAIMEGLSYNSIKIDNYPERYKTQREKEIERRRTEGLPMNLSYEDLQELLDPFYRSYKCKDGRMFYVVCPSHKQHAKRCLQTLGLYDELVELGLTEEEDTYLPVSEWSSDVSLGVYPLPRHWAVLIAERMKEVFMTRTSKEWKRIFGRGKFPGAPHR